MNSNSDQPEATASESVKRPGSGTVTATLGGSTPVGSSGNPSRTARCLLRREDRDRPRLQRVRQARDARVSVLRAVAHQYEARGDTAERESSSSSVGRLSNQ